MVEYSWLDDEDKTVELLKNASDISDDFMRVCEENDFPGMVDCFETLLIEHVKLISRGCPDDYARSILEKMCKTSVKA